MNTIQQQERRKDRVKRRVQRMSSSCRIHPVCKETMNSTMKMNEIQVQTADTTVGLVSSKEPLVVGLECFYCLWHTLFHTHIHPCVYVKRHTHTNTRTKWLKPNHTLNLHMSERFEALSSTWAKWRATSSQKLEKQPVGQINTQQAGEMSLRTDQSLKQTESVEPQVILTWLI